jgi:hypothetical protein
MQAGFDKATARIRGIGKRWLEWLKLSVSGPLIPIYCGWFAAHTFFTVL